jgi:hypothetical protein
MTIVTLPLTRWRTNKVTTGRTRTTRQRSRPSHPKSMPTATVADTRTSGCPSARLCAALSRRIIETYYLTTPSLTTPSIVYSRGVYEHIILPYLFHVANVTTGWLEQFFTLHLVNTSISFIAWFGIYSGRE